MNRVFLFLLLALPMVAQIPMGGVTVSGAGGGGSGGGTVAPVNAKSWTQSTSGATVAFTGFDPGTSNLVLFGCAYHGTVADPTGITFGGTPMTKIDSYSTTVDSVTTWQLKQTFSPGALDFSVSGASGSGVIPMCAAISFANTNATTYLGTSFHFGNQSTAFTHTITSATGEIAVDFLWTSGVNKPCTAGGGTNTVQAWSNDHDFYGEGLCISTASGAASVTMGYADSAAGSYDAMGIYTTVKP